VLRQWKTKILETQDKKRETAWICDDEEEKEEEKEEANREGKEKEVEEERE
jgi:hypothetical protein